jgi:MEMO1 family protein
LKFALIRSIYAHVMGRNSVNTRVHKAAVAGMFYPGEPSALRSAVAQLLERVAADSAPLSRPKALIVPHAGYPYSGPVAAAAYARLASRRDQISRVVLIGPSHHVYFHGIALPEADVFATPLGHINVDAGGKAVLLARGDVVASDAPFESEHCLEVQLPFLQSMLSDFTILPLVAGIASPEYVASVLADVWGGDETLVLASSDLSHYHSYQSARRIDTQTAAAIVAREPSISPEQACGAVGINGLLALARERNLTVEKIAYLNSGDTAGDRDRVVGYGAFSVYEP